MREDLKLSEAYDGFIFLAESRRNPPMLRSHRHPELELNLVTQGSVTYIISGQRYTFPRGSMLWIFPSQEHQLVNRSTDASYYVAVFKPGLIRELGDDPRYAGLAGDSGATGPAVLAKRLEPASYAHLTHTLDSLMADALDADLLNREVGFGYNSNFRFEHGDPLALNTGLRYLLVLCWKAFASGSAGSGAIRLHPVVQRALDLLAGEGLQLDLPQLAARCRVSVSYLSRLFRQQVGVPLNHYRNSVRLRLFMEQCDRPDSRTILEAVFAAGFGSYAQFYKVFVQAYGCGPRQYLRGRTIPLT